MAENEEPPPKDVLKAMISSTITDLPDHREQVKDACLRQGMLPLMMEHRPPVDKDAIEFSLGLVDDADIYVGVYGSRYGYVPKDGNPKQISVTEMEYDRAVERGMPKLIFVMNENHPINFGDMEQGEGAVKLKAFLDRVKTTFVNFFNSPEELRTLVVSGIADAKAKLKESKLSEQTKPGTGEFHYVSNIPTPPEAYIAHPYTLLQTHGLVGRQPELNLLTNWVSKPDSDIYKAHILSIVAIGGMGKSALTWKWFEEIAPQEMKPLAGRMWWSFYESDASFENFIIRALAYVSKRSIEEIRQFNAQDREAELLTILDKKTFLIVLDGLERILIAYARMDAAYLSDSDYDKRTANYVASAYGLPPEAAQSFTGRHLVRKTADPRAGAFLRKLSKVRAARIFISTRLYPLDLQRGDALPLPGCFAIFLPGLSNDDALNLWRSFGVSGSHDQLLAIFSSFGNHALLIQALASEVANYRPTPGDFEKWRKANPDFDPAKYPHIQDAMGHVLEFALRGLGERERSVLQTIAGFRMPTHYDTLSAVLIGEGKACKNAGELDATLSELEDRGLIGWDKRANRYDLHPIVRGVVWSGLGDDARQGVYTSLHSHFEAVPMVKNWKEVSSLEDLTPAIELYSTLIGMGRYKDACDLFDERLDDATLYRLSANRQRVEMLEMLFPEGLDEFPRLSDQAKQAYTLNSLAHGYKLSGQPGRAAPLYRRNIIIRSAMGGDENPGIGLENLSDTLRSTGSLRESEEVARRGLGIARKRDFDFREAVSLYILGQTLAALGKSQESGTALQRSLDMFIVQNHHEGEGQVNAFLAQRAIWFGEYAEALRLANCAWELAYDMRLERDFIEAARVQGEAALGLNDLVTAGERLHHALPRARAVNLVEEELLALIALSELRRKQEKTKDAREFLDDVWEFAERGPYPLHHADALNVLSQIERDAGNKDKAIEAAAKAYQLSWCDGPPYAYHWGLIKAQKHLEELGAPLPEMPAFDESKFEPMPEVEIDPEDEFHVGDSSPS
jgi:tetratricopeptide (TPR) repeat protein